MRLSKRQKAIANLIPYGARICDIGTDNAQLPCWLILNGITEFAVAADLSKNCITRAAEAARVLGVDDQIRFVCCNGLAGIEAEEFDILVITGMGGETIIEILEAGKSKLSGKTLILSAHTKHMELLDWLRGNGFLILKELLVRDRKKTYLIQICEYSG